MALATRGPDVAVEATVDARNYVDWGAIIAGMIVALAISTLFITFGSAIGLSMTDLDEPRMPGTGTSATAIIIAIALWTMWVQLSGFLAGGYVAGRMRRRFLDATEEESTVRDGMHGLIVWALATVLGAALAAWIAGQGISTLTSAGASAVSTAASATATSPALQSAADRLLRSAAAPATAGTSTGGTQAATTTPPSSGATTAAPGSTANTTNTMADDAAEIGRIFASSPSMSLSDEDRAYVAQVIARRTGMSQADAEARLDQTVQDLKAKADTARRYGVYAAFLTAATLLIGAVAAWWAATMGGDHRDSNADHRMFASWR